MQILIQVWVGPKGYISSKLPGDTGAAGPRAPRSPKTLSQRPPAASVELAQVSVLVVHYLPQAPKPRTPQIRVAPLKGISEVVQHSSSAQLRLLVLGRVLYISNHLRLLPCGRVNDC